MNARERAIAAVRDELGIAVQPGRVLRAIESAGLEVIDRAELERLRLAEKWAEADIVAEDSWDANIAELQALEKVASAAMTAYRAARKEGK